MIRLACSLVFLTLLSGCGIFEIYGKRAYAVERFQVIDEKSKKPMSDVDLVVMATHGPQILPAISIGRPKDINGKTDQNGKVSLRIPQGPKIERLAYGIKNDFVVLYEWEMNWPKATDGTIVLLGNSASRWQYKEK